MKMSSFFIAHKCLPKQDNNVHDESSSSSVVCMAASDCTGYPFIVAISSGHSISFYCGDGPTKKACDDIVNETVADATNSNFMLSLLSWKPQSRTLAVGRDDGQLSIWSFGDDNNYDRPKTASLARPSSPATYYSGKLKFPTCTYVNAKIHRNKFVFLQWNKSGSRLVSGDVDGAFCIWGANYDSGRDAIMPLVKYQRNSMLTCAVFCEEAGVLAADERSDNLGDEQNEITTTIAFGMENGTVCIANDSGKCTNISDLSSCIDHIMFDHDKRIVVAITRARVLALFPLQGDGTVSEKSLQKVKLSIPGDINEKVIRAVVWVAPGVLGCATGENLVRLWDLWTNENHVLSLNEAGLDRSEKVESIAFDHSTCRLAAGLASGRWVLWKHADVLANRKDSHASAIKRWDHVPTICPQLEELVVSLSFVRWKDEIIMAKTANCCYICENRKLRSAFNEGVGVAQIDESRCAIERSAGGITLYVETGMRIDGLTVDSRHLVIWSRREIRVFSLFEENVELRSEIPCQARSVALYEDTLFIGQDNQLFVTNLNGVQRLSIHFTAEEGFPIHLDASANFLAIATNCGVLKIFDVSKKEPMLLRTPGKFVDQATEESIGHIQSIRCNSNGSMISIVSSRNISFGTKQPKPSLHIYNAHHDIVYPIYLDNDEDSPVSHYWDPAEPKLLTCEVQRSTSTSEKYAHACTSTSVIKTLFITEEGKIFTHDTFTPANQAMMLIGVNAPMIYFAKSMNAVNTESDRLLLLGVTMRDFDGLENEGPFEMAALIDFSYYMTVGNIDRAYRSVHMIKNPSVWENLAHICIMRRRLDLAETCLANMGHASGSEAVRLAKSEPEEEVALAAVAIQLGLLDDAARLYTECNRYDLLCALFCRQGKWEDAIAIARDESRVHLQRTHFEFGIYLDSIGNSSGAIEQFGQSNQQRFAVLRNLARENRFKDIEAIIAQTKDEESLKWFAAYCESTSDLEKAKEYYLLANDYLSLVRLYCNEGDLLSARSIAEESGNAAAAHYLGRHLEGVDDVKDAIHFYALSETYNHAIRLAKTHSFDSELMTIARKSQPSQVIECARYFEKKGEIEKAAQLYLSGGNTKTALEICLHIHTDVTKEQISASGLDDIFIMLVDSLNADAPDTVIDQCIRHLIDLGDNKRAIDLLFRIGRSFDQAIKLCTDHNILLTETLTERLSSSLSRQQDQQKINNNNSNSSEDTVTKNEKIKTIAIACEKQGNYQLACKKYTEAGDRCNALRCLLKTGDTKNIISFASVSRRKETYIMAANYLQTQNCIDNSQITKTIIQFYKKAKSPAKLIDFYDSHAQSIIDKTHDYSKAFDLLKEAKAFILQLSRNGTCSSNSDKDEELKQKIHSLDIKSQMLQNYLHAQNLFSKQKDVCTAEQLCLSLLDHHDKSTEKEGNATKKSSIIVQYGDCSSLLICHYLSIQNYQAAYHQMGKLTDRNIKLEHYMDKYTIDQVYQGVGKSSNKDINKECGSDSDHCDVEETDEEVGDELSF